MADFRPNADEIIIGQLGRPHGLLGWIHTQIFCENIELLFNPELSFAPTGGRKTLTLDGFHPKKQPTRLKFAQLRDRNEAARWTGVWLIVPMSCLPAPTDQEYYRHELIGFQVYTPARQSLGRLIAWLETGAHDVCVALDVASNKKRLIPFVEPEVVLEICRSTRSIVVQWEPEW